MIYFNRLQAVYRLISCCTNLKIPSLQISCAHIAPAFLKLLYLLSFIYLLSFNIVFKVHVYFSFILIFSGDFGLLYLPKKRVFIFRNLWSPQICPLCSLVFGSVLCFVTTQSLETKYMDVSNETERNNFRFSGFISPSLFPFPIPTFLSPTESSDIQGTEG